MSNRLGFRIILKLGSWFVNLFNIRLLIRRPDQKLVAELISRFENLPIIVDSEKKLNALSIWEQYLNSLRENVLNNDIHTFLKWDVINYTMNHGSHCDYVYDELLYLKTLRKWSVYKKSFKEPWLGERSMYPFFPRASANSINSMNHIARFESNTAIQIKSHDCIVEFGGGYGNMCRLNFNLGFEGGYIIFDFAHFSFLQQYYLKSLNLPVVTVDEFIKSKNGIVCISNIGELSAILDGYDNKSSILLVAMWSISEAPISVRDSFLEACGKVSNFMIGYRNEFENNDNIKYFDSFKLNHDSVSWNDIKIEYLQEQNYLFGHTK